MKSVFTITLILFVSCSKNENQKLVKDNNMKMITNVEYENLLNTVAKGWNTNNARLAADCFSEDVVYIEPPDLQLYEGRDALFEFFGGEEGRALPMSLEWHHLIFDEQKQVGSGEYTFKYRGRITHGLLIIQIKNGLIHRWREYQVRTEIEFDEFVGKSQFD
jgi:hypothetical protein